MPSMRGATRFAKWIALPLLAAGIYLVVNRLVNWAMFHPERYPVGQWHLQEHLGAEDVWLTTADHVRIHGWKLRGPQPPQWITLYLHGNGGNLSYRVDHMQMIPQAGSDLFIIDYRGYGRSEGSPSEQGVYRDADTAYEYLVAAGYPPDRIILYGESLGTAAAVDLAARHACAGVILEAPFPSAYSVAGNVIPVLGPLLARGRLETAKKLRAVHVPLLVIHGTQDQVIDYRLGQEVFAAANEPKEFWTIEGAHHSDITEVAGAEYVERLRRFLSRLQQPVRKAG